MHARQHLRRLLILVSMLIGAHVAMCREAESLVAVIDSGGAPELCSLLESRLTKDQNWKVYTRDPAVVAEKQLQTLVHKSDWGALRKLMRVDVLVLTGKNEEGKIWARVIAIARASVITETWFNHDPAQIDVQAGYLKSLLDRDRFKLGSAEGKIVKLSVGSAASTPEYYLQVLEQPLKNRLLHRLANNSQVILNERRNLDNVVWERSLDASMTIAPPTGQTALSCDILRKDLELTARASLLFPDGRSLEHVFSLSLDPLQKKFLLGKDPFGPKPVVTPADESGLDSLSKAISEWVIQATLGDKGSSVVFSAEAEAEYYARQAKFLVSCGMSSQGAAAADAAWALGIRTPELLRQQIMAHAMLAFPSWDGLQDWDYARPRQGGQSGPSYYLLSLKKEPWRITAAIRTAELLRTYLSLYKDQTPKGFDDDPRILGTRCLYNALCVLMSASELELSKNSTYATQISTLRSLIADSAEELLRMPCTFNSAPLYFLIAPFIPAWAEPLNKRMEIWDLYLESPQTVSLHSWMRFAETQGFTFGPTWWERGLRIYQKPKGEEVTELETVVAKGNPVGMVFPWEPEALQRRKQLLDTFVGMIRSSDTKKQDKGWALWLLWWRNEGRVREHHDVTCVSRFDHDFPGFSYVEEARAAWDAPKEVDFSAWIEAKQAAYAKELAPRLAKVFPAKERIFGGMPVIPNADIRFYQWYLREIVLYDSIKDLRAEFDTRRDDGPKALYLPPKSTITLQPVSVDMKKPKLASQDFTYMVDGDTIYAQSPRKTGKLFRLDPVSNKLHALDIPKKVHAVVADPEGAEATVCLGPKTSWITGSVRFAYRLGHGEWQISDCPSGSPVPLNDKLYFLASDGNGRIDLSVNSTRSGALYEFNPQTKKTTCLFSTRRFPPLTILDAHEPVIPVAVYSSSQGVLHVMTAEEQKSLWCIYRRKSNGDFEKIHTVACPHLLHGAVTSCGGQTFLHFMAGASNAPYCYWSSWALLDGDSPIGFKPLWQDPRIKKDSLPFPAAIPPGNENGPYVKHGNLSYRIEDAGSYPPNYLKKSKNRRYQIEILNPKSGQYYSVPLTFNPFPEDDELSFADWGLAATATGIWIGHGDWYALVPYQDLDVSQKPPSP